MSAHILWAIFIRFKVITDKIDIELFSFVSRLFLIRNNCAGRKRKNTKNKNDLSDQTITYLSDARHDIPQLKGAIFGKASFKVLEMSQ